MSQSVTISLDAMGGDAGPEVVIGGAAIALDRHPDLRFAIFGREDTVRPALEAHPRVAVTPRSPTRTPWFLLSALGLSLSIQ